MFAVLAAGTAAFLFVVALVLYVGNIDDRLATEVTVGGFIALAVSVLAHVNAPGHD